MSILNKISDECISDTVERCFRTSIGGYCYPSVGAYLRGSGKPHYPVPAIIYEAVFPWEDAGYADMIYVNDLSGGEDDPYLVACWDWDFGVFCEWRGKYQPCYDDARAEWYKQHNAWGL
jgi:hypothetical protein